jgi:glycosyltransferase involved in cell wall biosynthesis
MPETMACGRQTREKLNVPEDAVVIGYVGRIVADKGIEALVESFVRVQQVVSNVHLLLVGRVEPMRSRLGQATLDIIECNTNIHKTGQVPDPVPFYSAMDILVLPSRREGFGLTLIEAGALGLPVIGTQVTGCVDAVVEDVTGLLVPVDDVAALATAMLRLIREPELRRKLGQQGCQRVRKLFGSEHFIMEHIGLYESVSAKRIGH